MTSVSPVNSVENNQRYSAVKIKIENPQANIMSCGDVDNNSNSTYNAVDLAVTNPKLNKLDKPIYDYPIAPNPVMYQQANIQPVNVPFVGDVSGAYKNALPQEEPKPQVVEVNPPAPNLTTIEAEKAPLPDNVKADLASANKVEDGVEIVPPVEIKPSVDINGVVKNLKDDNYDTQAKQMEEIVRTTMQEPKSAENYLVTDVFSSLIDVLNKDTSKLEGPSEEVQAIRGKIIENVMAEQKATANGQKVELPHKLSQDEINKANALSSLEMAERNKEYAIDTIIVLAKAYTDAVKERTGDVVPITDIPGISDIVQVANDNPNPSLRAAAVDALSYMDKPEYADELKSVFEIAAHDSDNIVADTAKVALGHIQTSSDKSI